MRSTLLLVATFALLSLNTSKAQEATRDKNNPVCLEMVVEEINKDLEFLMENPEGNDSAIYHLTRLRNRILAKKGKPDERRGNWKQDSIVTSHNNAAIQEQINELKRERERLVKSISEANPIINNLDKQIEKLEQSKRNNK